VTLSGRGDQLAQFINDKLPSHYRIRTTNVLTLYHSRERLINVFQQTIDDLESNVSSMLAAPVASVIPFFSTIPGAPLIFSDNTGIPTTLRQLVARLLEMILLEPVDWVSVHESILSELAKHADSEPCQILNFGPGYGMSKLVRPLPQTIEIRDVSATGAYRIPASEASGVSLDDVAIVGMAVELPDAQDADLLWKNLCNGVDSCSEVSDPLN
jgi:Beta-ketoacyl synthase, N-terminal domain